MSFALVSVMTAQAAPGLSSGVDLTWKDCVGTGLETANQNFTCAGTVNQNYTLVVQFKSPVPIPNLVQITANLHLLNQTPGPLAPFWHYENGGCNNTGPTRGISLSDNIQALPNCAPIMPDPWDGDGSGGFEGIAAYVPDYQGQSGAALMILSDARGSSVAIEAGITYYAFHLVFNNRNRTACAGCSQPVAIKLAELRLDSNDGSPPVILKGPDNWTDCVTINGAPAAMCDLICTPETCDGIDNDCDNKVDNIVTYYLDADNDGYGNPSASEFGCSIPVGYVANSTDCDDTRAWVHPGAAEVCDGFDNDCNARVDEIAQGPGLVGWWRGEGNANDAVGTNHGTPQNGATFAAGQVGQAFSLDGINDFVGGIGGLSSFSFIQNTGVFTIESWIRLNAPNAIGEQTITANTATTIEKGHYFNWDNSTGQQQLRLLLMKAESGNPVISAASQSQVITNSNWHHVAVVGNGNGITFYVDGTAYPGSGTMGSKSTGNSTRAMYIGRCGASQCQFGGQIDEPAAYSRALSASEIRAIYNAGSGGHCALVSVADPPAQAGPFALAPPWPNPSRGRVTHVQFTLPAAAEVRADVYDLAGRRLATVLRAELPAGEHRAAWDGRDGAGRRVAAGIYQIRVWAGGALAVRKVVIIE